MTWTAEQWRAWAAEVAYVEPFPDCPGPEVQPCWDRTVEALKIRRGYRVDQSKPIGVDHV